MYIDFDTINDAARVWVYQTNRSLTEIEKNSVANYLKARIDSWAAHQQALLGSFQVVNNRFVVVAVDENQHLPSGCSIDVSTHWFQELGATLGVDFFDRSVVFIDLENNIDSIPVANAKSAVSSGRINPETFLLNTLVKTKSEFLLNWKIPASDSWLKRFFKTEPQIY